MNKYILKSVVSLVIASFILSPAALAAGENVSFFASLGALMRSKIVTEFAVFDSKDKAEQQLPTVNSTALVAQNTPPISFTPVSADYRTHTVTITAYSSSVDETDDTPFITASNTRTRDGVIAANFLPFGTKVKIPELFGDKTFVVEDRMNRRYTNRVDIWFPSKWQAKQFGKQTAQIVAFYDDNELASR